MLTFVVAQSCPTLWLLALLISNCVMDCSLQGSSVQGFSRQEFWSGLPFPSLRDLPDPGIKPRSPALQADTLPSEPDSLPTEPPGNKSNFLFFWLCHGACRILVFWAGIKLRHLLHWKYSLNHWTARQVPSNPIFLTDITLLGLTHYLSEISNTCQDTHTHTHTHTHTYYYSNTKCPVGTFPHLN